MARDEIKCTFCGKSSEDKTCLCLIASQNKAYICNECIETASYIVGVYKSGRNKIIYMGDNE